MRWFLRSGLRVLMYHQVSPSTGDGLTVTTAQLAGQLDWLRAEGFTFTTLAHVAAAASGRAALGPQSVLVTFDDAYRDTWELARPILAARQIPAVVFVPTAYVGGTSSWDHTPRPLMSAAQLRDLAALGWELGLHSHQHRNYRELAAEEIAQDVQRCRETFDTLGLPAGPGFAFPYGGRPREPAPRAALRTALTAAGVSVAFRIGNRVNPPAHRDPFELNRLGPRGDRSDASFRRQVRWGRLF
jgi:peptidoglycan/xylan/chitin deacetylase (PgdA/CDA1 family)